MITKPASGGGPQKTAVGNLIPGGSLKNYRGGINDAEVADLSVEKQNEDALRHAVVVLYKDDDGKVLTVTNDGVDVNIPGGTVKDGEDPIDAARREFWEETGLTAGKLVPIFKGRINGKFMTAFRAFDVSGNLRSSFEGDVVWSDVHDVEASRHGQFFKILNDKVG